MDTKQEYRYERKYRLNEAAAMLLKGRIAKVLTPDTHSNGSYHISSLYFDDHFNTAMHQKQDGILRRSKLRLRYYNNDKSYIRLEHKIKYGEMVRKESVRATEEQFGRMSCGDYGFITPENGTVWKTFYAVHTTRRLRPVVMVDYDREAYVCLPGNVRVTFDSNLRTAHAQSSYSINVLPKAELVLEVKYDHFLPEVVSNLLSGVPLTTISLSKYVLSRLKV